MNEGQESINNMLGMLAKAALLVVIILCIFFIVYPGACQNMMTNNVIDDSKQKAYIEKPLTPVNSDNPQGAAATTQPAATAQPADASAPAAQTTAAQPAVQPAAAPWAVTIHTQTSDGKIFDTTVNQEEWNNVFVPLLSTTPGFQAPSSGDIVNVTPEEYNALAAYRQKVQDMYDYDVIRAYVQLEKDYLKTHPNDKDSSITLGNQIMAQKNLTQQDWNDILQKATSKGWLDELRAAAAAPQTQSN